MPVLVRAVVRQSLPVVEAVAVAGDGAQAVSQLRTASLLWADYTCGAILSDLGPWGTAVASLTSQGVGPGCHPWRSKKCLHSAWLNQTVGGVPRAVHVHLLQCVQPTRGHSIPAIYARADPGFPQHPHPGKLPMALRCWVSNATA